MGQSQAYLYGSCPRLTNHRDQNSRLLQAHESLLRISIGLSMGSRAPKTSTMSHLREVWDGNYFDQDPALSNMCRVYKPLEEYSPSPRK